MNIAIIGTGYVGLVSGVCFARIGHDVICVDNNKEKVKQLKEGRPTIYEPGLEKHMVENMKNGRLSFTTSIKEAAKVSDVIFLAVGTPSKKNGDADLTYIENASRDIAEVMDSYKLIVEKSTVPAQTGEKIRRTIALNLPKEHRKGNRPLIEFDVASNPEFLREGSALDDFMNPDRVVIGVESKRAERLLKEIYKPLKTKIVVTNTASAEMIKHASNSFLATKISFINAVAQICDNVGADVLKVAEGMGFDKRIGRAFLNAGVGYGGSCFPKDVDAFIRLSEKSGYDFRMLREVRNINEQQKKSFLQLIENKLWIVKDKTIGVLGLAFKSNTDDMRNASSVDIINGLRNEGAKIKAYDPQSMGHAKKMIDGVTFCKDPYSVAKGCDALLLLTEWDEFAQLDMQEIFDNMKQPILFDGRNFYEKAKLEKIGFEYYGIGRGIH